MEQQTVPLYRGGLPRRRLGGGQSVRQLVPVPARLFGAELPLRRSSSVLVEQTELCRLAVLALGLQRDRGERHRLLSREQAGRERRALSLVAPASEHSRSQPGDREQRRRRLYDRGQGRRLSQERYHLALG